MKIRQAEFARGCSDVASLPPDDKPQIAFCGRSNVGKSTLLNELTGSKGLARTSKTPGRTQALNLFLINRSFYFVDLPGFGYAKGSKALEEKLGTMITEYLQEAPLLRGVVFLLDIRHPPSELDHIMEELIRETGRSVLRVATKSDKVSTNKRKMHLRKIREVLELAEDDLLLPVSAKKGDGVKRLLGHIESHWLTA